MQGKFQMQVLPAVGHTVHEDSPDKVPFPISILFSGREWSRPETLQGFWPLLAMIANLEIHRLTTPVLHRSTFISLWHSSGTTIEEPKKLKRVARQLLPIYLHFQ